MITTGYKKKTDAGLRAESGKAGDLFDKCRTFTTAKEVMAAGFYPYFSVVESAQDPEVIVAGKKMIMLGSNNYLGLTSHPKVKKAAIEAVKKYGSGCAGSRFLNGTLDIHVELEEKLAKFFRKDAALTFSTGYQTNLGIISSLAGKDDVVVIDKLDHASIIDACRLSFAEVKKFKHNDMDSLDFVLHECGDRGKLVVVDGVYSMEGDIAPLPDIVRVCKKYGARLMVDDAHGIGVLGKTGRGTAEHFGLEKDVDVIMGTYSKSLASIGGFVAADEDVIHYMKHTLTAAHFQCEPSARLRGLGHRGPGHHRPGARPQGTPLAQHEQDDESVQADGLRHRRCRNAHHSAHDGRDGTGVHDVEVLNEGGVFANPVVPPAMPQGRCMIRTSYMATHTDEMLDRVLAIVEQAGKKLGVIS